MQNENLVFQVYDQSTKLWYISNGWISSKCFGLGHNSRAVSCGTFGVSLPTMESYSSYDFYGYLCRVIDLNTLEVLQYLYNGDVVEPINSVPDNIVEIDGKYYKKIDD